MATQAKTVVRFDGFIHPIAVARYEREPDIELITMSRDDDAKAWEHFATAHIYQIGSARDELDPQFYGHAALIERCPNLLCISTGGAGYDTVEVADCTAAGILVVNQTGGNALSVAEHALGLILDVSKRISETDRYLRTDRGITREKLMGHEISGLTLGIVGIGNIGKRVAAFARAFDMTVLATDPYVDAATIESHGARKVELDELLEQSDIVTLHCPRDATTLNMIDAAAFARMKKDAIFITTCRGGIHDEEALYQALQSGHLRGAGLDVWAVEPPPLDHPLLSCPNVVATYHTAGVTHEARAQMAQFASEQAIGVLRGQRPPRLVNPEVWPAYVKRFERIIGHMPEE
jgi:D-3-phosphoglycerate dehydrogenase / 2-oxoglutarate reductase